MIILDTSRARAHLILQVLIWLFSFTSPLTTQLMQGLFYPTQSRLFPYNKYRLVGLLWITSLHLACVLKMLQASYRTHCHSNRCFRSQGSDLFFPSSKVQLYFMLKLIAVHAIQRVHTCVHIHRLNGFVRGYTLAGKFSFRLLNKSDE